MTISRARIDNAERAVDFGVNKTTRDVIVGTLLADDELRGTHYHGNKDGWYPCIEPNCRYRPEQP